MNPLTQTRQDVADALAVAGMNAFAFVPDRVSPPLAAVMTGNPYVEDGTSITNNLVRLVVRVILTPAADEVATAALEDSITKVITALRNDQWSISVGEFGEMTIGNANYPAVDVTITNYITI